MSAAARPQLVLGTQYAAGVFNGLMIVGENRTALGSLLSYAAAAGIRTVDTAPIYARTLAETTIGEHWTGAVWTKVGVDVARALPSLDYDEAAMERGLRASLRRLGRDRVDAALLHNPSLAAFDAIDLPALRARWLDELGLCRWIGLSLHGPSEMRWLAERASYDIDLLMLELPPNSMDWDAIAALAARYPVALRGLFGQGAWFRRQPTEVIGNELIEYVLAVSERIRPAYLVIAPRTVAQAQDYATLCSHWAD